MTCIRLDASVMTCHSGNEGAESDSRNPAISPPLASGLLTWCESCCEVCGLEEPKAKLAYHIIAGHGLEGVATLHNYLASIFTVFGRPSRKRFQ